MKARASLPSSLSALRLSTLACLLTARGGPESTLRSRAGPAPLLVSLLTESARLERPTLKKSPSSPKAAEAAPTTSASMMADPRTVEVALPIHNTLLTTFLSILLYLLTLCHETKAAYSPRWGDVSPIWRIFAVA